MLCQRTPGTTVCRPQATVQGLPCAWAATVPALHSHATGVYGTVANEDTTRLIPRTNVSAKGQRQLRQALVNGPGCILQPLHTHGCIHTHRTYPLPRQPPSDRDPNP